MNAWRALDEFCSVLLWDYLCLRLHVWPHQLDHLIRRVRAFVFLATVAAPVLLRSR